MNDTYTQDDLLDAILVVTISYDIDIQRYRDAVARDEPAYIDLFSMINAALAQLYVRTVAQKCDYSDTPQVKLLVQAMVDLQTRGHFNYPTES